MIISIMRNSINSQRLILFSLDILAELSFTVFFKLSISCWVCDIEALILSHKAPILVVLAERASKACLAELECISKHSL